MIESDGFDGMSEFVHLHEGRRLYLNKDCIRFIEKTGIAISEKTYATVTRNTAPGGVLDIPSGWGYSWDYGASPPDPCGLRASVCIRSRGMLALLRHSHPATVHNTRAVDSNSAAGAARWKVRSNAHQSTQAISRILFMPGDGGFRTVSEGSIQVFVGADNEGTVPLWGTVPSLCMATRYQKTARADCHTRRSETPWPLLLSTKKERA